MEKIPLVDLKAQYRELKEEIDGALLRTVEEGRFVLGETVEAFEREFAAFCWADHAVGVANGTDALTLALRACGIRSGDGVVTVPNTFIATAEAISAAGAVPFFVDVAPSTSTLDPARLEHFLEQACETRADGRPVHRGRSVPIAAVIPVHLFGHPADTDAICAMARRFGLRVIEDAAQAHGASFRGRRVGTLGEAACFSFYPGKNLGAFGDAGAVVTCDEEVASKVRLLRNHGRREKYEHLIEGCNSRLDAIQAAILRVKLPRLEGWNERRREAARLYDDMLGDVEGIICPQAAPESVHVYHLYVIRAAQRDRLRERLAGEGVSTGIHYPIPLHLQPAYRYLGYREGDFQVAEELACEILSLPMYPEIRPDQIRRIASLVRSEAAKGSERKEKR